MTLPPDPPAPRVAEATVPGAYRVYVLAALVTVYTFNFIDRQIIGILAVPIKAELVLDDARLGLMGGLAFALFYTFLGIPIARLADRTSRIDIMTAALAVWSVMTAVCGLTHTFLQLFLARLGVGVGEAGGVAPAYSLICDYFPQRQRARALSLYSFGIPIGSAAGAVIGGFMAHWMSWRSAFVAVGLAGLAVAPLLKLTVREPRRGGLDEPWRPGVDEPRRPGVDEPRQSVTEGTRQAAVDETLRSDVDEPRRRGVDVLQRGFGDQRSRRGTAGAIAGPDNFSLAEVVAHVAKRPSFWALAFGAASASTMGYGLFFWLPSFLVRSFALTLVRASLAYAGLVLVGGLVGIWLGGVGADRYAARHKRAYAAIPALAFVATIPCYVAGVLSSSLPLCLGVLVVPTALGLVWLAPVLTAVQHLVPPGMRATATALFLFINNLVGIGVGTAVIGRLSDGLKLHFGHESLRYAIVAGTGFYVLAAVLLWIAARHLTRDWVD